ncbi:MAG: YeiH family protein [Candidatus Dormibacteria bacterium]
MTAAAAALPGLALAAAVAAVATLLASRVPLAGAPVLGIVFGAALSPVVRPGARLAPGLEVAGKFFLQAAIVLLGTGLSLGQVARVGGGSLPVMVGTLLIGLGSAWWCGRLLGIGSGATTLIGVGTSVCGASAIAAVTAVMDVADADVAYAIGTVFTFNIAAVLLFPVVGHLLGLSQHAFGLWSGTAINDTSSVVAAAYSYGADAGSYGVVVKLTRTLMIIPICAVLVGLRARRLRRGVHAPAGGGGGRLRWTKIIPLFLGGFLLASALDTAHAIPSSWHANLNTAGLFLITLALAGIGLSIRLAQLRRAGARPLVLGGILWVTVAVSSLVLQALTGTL